MFFFFFFKKTSLRPEKEIAYVLHVPKKNMFVQTI